MGDSLSERLISELIESCQDLCEDSGCLSTLIRYPKTDDQIDALKWLNLAWLTLSTVFVLKTIKFELEFNAENEKMYVVLVAKSLQYIIDCSYPNKTCNNNGDKSSFINFAINKFQHWKVIVQSVTLSEEKI